jgi:glutathione-regulated potassium-efflux system ancillary protein KefG
MVILDSLPDGSEPGDTLAAVTPLVATEDLIDARGVAQILGLSHPNNVSVYQHRYADMPRPVVALGRGRCMLWLRPEVEEWAQELLASGRTRPKRRVTP